MSQTNDGGPAFPIESEVLKIGLRDWFAGQALENDILNQHHRLYHTGGYVKEPTREECRYAFADAMLAERAKERE